MFDHCWIQLLQTSKLLFGSLATPPFITARFQFIVLINCKTQQIKFELKYFPKMVSKMFRIDRKTIPIRYFLFKLKYTFFFSTFCIFIPQNRKCVVRSWQKILDGLGIESAHNRSGDIIFLLISRFFFSCNILNSRFFATF